MAELPAVSLYDNFNRANGNVSTGASQWLNKRVQENAATTNEVSSEKLLMTGNSSTLGATSVGPNTGIYITISTLPTQYIFLICRIASGGTSSWNGYGALWGPAVGENVQIRRYAAGASTVIKEAAVTFAAGDIFAFQAVSSALTVLKKHETTVTEVTTVTDTTYSAAGPVGVWGGDTTARYDELFAGTIGGEEPTSTARLSMVI